MEGYRECLRILWHDKAEHIGRGGTTYSKRCFEATFKKHGKIFPFTIGEMGNGEMGNRGVCKGPMMTSSLEVLVLGKGVARSARRSKAWVNCK